MKTKLLILGLFCWFDSFAQSVPNTTTFSLSDVTSVVTGIGSNDLVECFAHAVDAYFDPTYKGSKNALYCFRNYTIPGATIPTVTTTAITAVTGSTATGGGNVTSDGGASVTARGVCWNTSTNPTVSNSHTSDGTGTGSFTSSLTGLTASTLYYVRAYATNSVGTAYGSNESFSYIPGYGKLYNAYAVLNAKNISASGWHVPTKTEVETLITAMGGSSTAGGPLKSTGYTNWDSPNTGATNSSGFSAYGTGIRSYNTGFFSYLNIRFEIYTSTYSGANPYGFAMFNTSASALINTTYLLDPKNGAAVRLIKDDSTDTGTYTGNDGKTYSTVTIGSQVWTSENLKETEYRDHTVIPQVTDGSAWVALTTGAFCWYNNNSGSE